MISKEITKKIFTFESIELMTTDHLVNVLINKRAEFPPGGVQIQFVSCRILFGNFKPIDLSHCHFIACEFRELASFDVSTLLTTRFTRSLFFKGINIDPGLYYDQRNGLFQEDYYCSIFHYDLCDSIIPRLSVVSSRKILEGYNRNRGDSVDDFRHLNLSDSRHTTSAVLQIITKAISGSNQIYANALKYAHLSDCLSKGLAFKFRLMNEYVAIGLSDFSSSSIYATNGGQEDIDFSTIERSKLIFRGVEFMHRVNFASSKTVDGDFTYAVFKAGVVIDASNMSVLRKANFESANCPFIYFFRAGMDPKKLIPLKAYEFFRRFWQYYTTVVQKGASPLGFLDSYIQTIDSPGKAEGALLNFFSQQDLLWANATFRLVMENLAHDLLIQQNIWITGIMPETKLDSLFIHDLLILHSNLFETAQIHGFLIEAIESQRLEMIMSLPANNAPENSGASKQTLFNRRVLLDRLSAVEHEAAVLLHTQNKLMMLKVAIYYGKFVNPDAQIFSKLYAQLDLSEPLVRDLYERGLPFNRAEVSRLFPALISKQVFFSRFDSRLTDDDDFDVDTKTQPPSPINYR
jgi:hypothetical protein